MGWGLGEGTDWLGREEGCFLKKETAAPGALGFWAAGIFELPVMCLVLCWAANFHSFVPLELTEHLLHAPVPEV